MPLLRAISKKETFPDESSGFPFSLPVASALDEIGFAAPVTFFVGENGSGKSTLLEAIAVGMKAVVVGSERPDRDESLAPARELAPYLQFVKTTGPKRGFFFRAEDFFGFVKSVKQQMGEFDDLEKHYDETLTGLGRQLAMGVARKSKGALTERYGKDPHAFSHGESFLNMFESRIVPGGLYLLDEPETPLSPLRQLSLLSLMKEMVEQGCQFIIATHSPILMAFPGANIISFDTAPPSTVAYDDVEHVALTREFLKDPEGFLRRL